MPSRECLDQGETRAFPTTQTVTGLLQNAELDQYGEAKKVYSPFCFSMGWFKKTTECFASGGHFPMVALSKGEVGLPSL